MPITIRARPAVIEDSAPVPAPALTPLVLTPEVDAEDAAIRAEVKALAAVAEQARAAADFLRDFDSRRKALGARVVAYRQAANNKPATFVTDTGVVEVSARRRERAITSMPKVYSVLGHEVFVSLAQIPFAELDKYLSPAEQVDLVTEDNTGARTVKIIPKA